MNDFHCSERIIQEIGGWNGMEAGMMLMVIDALSGGKMLQVESLRMDAPDFFQRSRADFTQPWSRLKDGSHDRGGKAGVSALPGKRSEL